MLGLICVSDPVSDMEVLVLEVRDKCVLLGNLMVANKEGPGEST